MKALLLALIPLFAHAGGISSGGGNVLFPVDPRESAHPDAIRSLIPAVRGDLLAYLRAKRGLWRAGRLSPEESRDFAPLFSATPDVLAIASGTGVDVELEAPCFDSQNRPFDGATVSDEADASVCLSALTISRRVEKRDVPAQSAALLAHEYSELAGFAEEEAVGLQARVLRDFRAAAR